MRAEFCPCTSLMPKLITPADRVRADKEFKEMFAYVRTLWAEGKTYRDKERASTFTRIFAERDGAHYNDKEAQVKGDMARGKKLDAKNLKEFQDRSINLDSEILHEALDDSESGEIL